MNRPTPPAPGAEDNPSLMLGVVFLAALLALFWLSVGITIGISLGTP